MSKLVHFFETNEENTRRMLEVMALKVFGPILLQCVCQSVRKILIKFDHTHGSNDTSTLKCQTRYTFGTLVFRSMSKETNKYIQF